MNLTSPFARFVTASGMTNLADGIAVVVWAWAASMLTRDPLLIALLPAALRLPWFLCAIPAGIITDRVDRKQLILQMDVARGVLFLIATIATWYALPIGETPATGVSNPTLFIALAVIAILVGVAEVFRDNAAQTMIPSIVPHDELERANGRLWSVEIIGNSLLGPALGAFLIAAFLPTPFALNAVCYLVAVLLIIRLKGNFKPEQTGERNWRREFLEAFRFLRSKPLLISLAWITGVWNLLFQFVFIGLVLHLKENMGLGPQAFGLILAAGAVGGICGGWWGDAIIRKLGQKRTTQWMLCATAPTFFAIAYAPNAIWIAITMALFEVTGITWNTVTVSYRQRMIPDKLLGRLNSLYRLLAWGMIPLGLVLSGLIVRGAETVMPRESALISPFVVGGIAAIFLTIVGWRALERGFGPDA